MAAPRPNRAQAVITAIVVYAGRSPVTRLVSVIDGALLPVR